MRRGFASTLLGAAALFFVGCGGGGSGPSTNPTATPGGTPSGTPNGTPNGTPSGTPVGTATPAPNTGGSPVTSGQIVFVSNRANPTSSITDIYKSNADGSNVVRLTNLGRSIDKPSVSSDGTRIVFQFDDPYGVNNANSDIELGIINTDGSGFQQLTSDVVPFGRPDDYNPVFAPNDQYIYWTSTRGGVAHIYRMNGLVGGTGGSQTQFISQQSAFPSVANNGDVAYLDYSIVGNPIAISTASGALKKRIPDATLATQIFDVAISPNGNRVAFSAGSTTGNQIRIYNALTNGREGSSPSGATGYGGSAWSRDSNTLFFDAVSGATRQVFSSSSTTNPPFSTQTQVTNTAGDTYSPAFLPLS